MPKIKFMPDGIEAEIPPGTSILEAARTCGAPVGSACGGVCACSTCHVYVLEGGDSLPEMEEAEGDILDKAFEVKSSSRLGCQSILQTTDVVVQITRESRQAYYDEHPNAVLPSFSQPG